MKFKFLFGGRRTGGHFEEGINEYVERIRQFFAVEVVSGKKEGDITRLLDQRAPRSYLIGLDEGGKLLTSEQFADLLRKILEEGKREIVFLLGGAEGLEQNWRDQCDLILSLSPLTFSHQLARLVLLEQVYRAMCIIANMPYHRY